MRQVHASGSTMHDRGVDFHPRADGHHKTEAWRIDAKWFI